MPYITGFHIKTHPRIRPLELMVDTTEVEFRHIIITGRNGTGKTTLLNALWGVVVAYPDNSIEHLGEGKASLNYVPDESRVKERSAKFETATKQMDKISYDPPLTEDEYFIRVFLKDERKLRHIEKPGEVPERVTPSNSLTGNESRKFVSYLKHQYLQKLLAKANSESELAEAIERWLDSLVLELSSIFEIDGLQLDFDSKTYELRFVEPNGTRYNFSQLSAGFSAVLDIVGELLMRLDGSEIDRSSKRVTGVALIDEIDTHLHPTIQKTILPFLVRMFPRIQFIVATHSPAVISSVDGAVVFDLDRLSACYSEEYRGIPYGQVLTGHFGLPTDLDNSTNALLEEAQALIEKQPRTDDEDNRLGELVQRLRKTGHPMIMLEYSQRLIANRDDS